MKDIIWGMPALVELNGIEDNAELCKSLGLSFIELNMNLPEYQPNKIDIERLMYLKRNYNLFYTIHLPEEFDAANFNEDIRAAYEKIFADTVAVAGKIDAPIINMHMHTGVYFTMPDGKVYLYKKYIEDYLASMKRFAAYSGDMLKNTGIKLCIENTGIYDTDYITKAVDELIMRDTIFLTWDIGHDHSSENKDKAYIMANADKLKHMHFHDAIGKNNHLPLFTGDIDIDEKMNIAKEHGCSCVIETKTVKGLKESVANLRDRMVNSWMRNA